MVSNSFELEISMLLLVHDMEQCCVIILVDGGLNLIFLKLSIKHAKNFIQKCRHLLGSRKA